MILYLDSSSLIKLYVIEQGSDEVRRLVEESSLLAASVVAYPEARSALARLRREGNLTSTGYQIAKAELERDWASYLTLEVTESVWRLAGDLTEKHGLEGSTASIWPHFFCWMPDIRRRCSSLPTMGG